MSEPTYTIQTYDDRDVRRFCMTCGGEVERPRITHELRDCVRHLALKVQNLEVTR